MAYTNVKPKGAAPGPRRPPLGVQEELILFGCVQCGKSIFSDQPYVEIMHYRPHPEKTTRKHFHPPCFEEVAGKDYV